MGRIENSQLQSPLRGWMGLLRRQLQGLMPLATNGRHSVANTKNTRNCRRLVPSHWAGTL